MAKVAGILGKKVGMTQLFDSKGEVRPANGSASRSVCDHATQERHARRIRSRPTRIRRVREGVTCDQAEARTLFQDTIFLP